MFSLGLFILLTDGPGVYQRPVKAGKVNFQFGAGQEYLS
jgi:hypothetical protein